MYRMLSDVAALATAAGVLAAVIQLLLSRRQSRATFEHEFVKRYWVLNDDRLMRPAEDDAMQQARYLRLCEDEFEVMRLGSISWRTWEVWHDAMREELGQDAGEHNWLAICLAAADDHRGADCPSIFESGTGAHSEHLTARWPSSWGRKWFIVISSWRRKLYERRRNQSVSLRAQFPSQRAAD